MQVENSVSHDSGERRFKLISASKYNSLEGKLIIIICKITRTWILIPLYCSSLALYCHDSTSFHYEVRHLHRESPALPTLSACTSEDVHIT